MDRRLHAAMEADAVVALSAKVLRSFIARLDATAQHDAEATAKSDAATWIAEHEANMADAPKELANLRDTIQRHADAAVQAIEIEAAWRRSLEARVHAGDVLAARFALPTPPRPPVNLGVLEDWATSVLSVVDGMRPSRGPRRAFALIGLPASATADERREATLRSVAEYIGKHGARLPREVRAIPRRRPDPAEALPTPPGPSEQE